MDQNSRQGLAGPEGGLLPQVLVLTLVCLISYALFLPRLGIYWDDWFLSLLYVHGGGQAIIDWHTSFRPFAGRNMGWMFDLLGMTPLPWQALTWVAHWLGVLCVLWGLRRLWPERPLVALAVAMLYAVYPGYSLRPIAVVSWHQLTGQNFMALSLAATIAARRARPGGGRAGLVLLAIVAALWSHLVYEAYFGLEGLRLALLWVLAGQPGQARGWTRIKAALSSALPYLFVLVPYLVWRVFFFDLLAGRPDFKGSIAGRLGDIKAEPLESLFTIGVNYYSSLANAMAMVWTFPLSERLKFVPVGVGWATVGVVLLSMGCLLAFLRWYQRRYESASPPPPAADVAGGSLAAGALAVVLLLPLTGFYTGQLGQYLAGGMGLALLLGLAWLAWRARQGAGWSAAWRQALAPGNPFWRGAALAFLVLLPYRYHKTLPPGRLALLFLVSACLVGIVLWLGRREKARPEGWLDTWQGQALLLGLVASLGGMLVPVAYGRKIELMSGVDRYTPMVALGVGLLYAGAWGSLARRRLGLALLALLVAVGVGFHFENSYHYQRGWSHQKDFWWQLRWRAPSLAPGTMLAVEAPNFPGIPSRYEIYSAARMAYPGLDLGGLTIRPEVARVFHQGDHYLDGAPEVGLKVPQDSRQALVLSKPRGCSCLRVLDKDRAFLAREATDLARNLAVYSRPELILAQPYPRPMDQAIFGPEPAHGWCYYYQKAELAGQMGDWPEVASLQQKAQFQGLKPQDPIEWLPFLEAQVRLGHAQEAARLADLLVPGLPPGKQPPPWLEELLKRSASAATLVVPK